MLANNVHYLKESVIFSQFNSFLNKYSSKNTRDAYERDIREFFKVIKDKEIEHLTEDDLEIKLIDIDEFKDILSNKGISGKTINRKVTALNRFMKYLFNRADDLNLNVDISSFSKIERMSESTKHHDAFEYDEFLEVVEWVRKNENNGKLKYSLIRYAVATGARLRECLDLTWDNFIPRKDCMIVEYNAKGNKQMSKEISHEFYKEMLELRQEGEKRVFPISATSVNRMMDNIKKHFKIPKSRKIVFHSFRKTGGTFIYERTGDINEARIFLGHSNINTTQIYLKKKEYGRIDAISAAEEVDLDFYKTLSHEELIKVIENLNKGQQLLLNIKAKEVYGLSDKNK